MMRNLEMRQHPVVPLLDQRYEADISRYSDEMYELVAKKMPCHFISENRENRPFPVSVCIQKASRLPTATSFGPEHGEWPIGPQFLAFAESCARFITHGTGICRDRAVSIGSTACSLVFSPTGDPGFRAGIHVASFRAKHSITIRETLN